MKHLASRVALLLLSASCASAETYVSGTITSNATWTLSGSPYIVVGDVYVAAGVTLTINAGVNVRFRPDSVLATGSPATLVANGEEADPVRFCSDAEGDEGALMFEYSSLVTLSYCVIEHLGVGIIACGPVNATSSTVQHCRSGVRVYVEADLSNLIVRDNVNYGIWVEEGSFAYIHECTIENNHRYGAAGQGGAWVDNCTIRNNGYDGVMIQGEISNCLISGNGRTGVTLGAGGTITNSTVSGNLGYGVYFVGVMPYQHPRANWNNLFDNGGYDLVTGSTCYAPTIDATHNYWGTANEVAIAARIRDRSDEPSLPTTVVFVPFEGAVPATSWTWGGVKDAFRR